jgi:hypothetical protein
MSLVLLAIGVDADALDGVGDDLDGKHFGAQALLSFGWVGRFYQSGLRDLGECDAAAGALQPRLPQHVFRCEQVLGDDAERFVEGNLASITTAGR